MSRTRLVAALVAAGLLVPGTGAGATETTTVAYSSANAAYLSVAYRESVDDTVEQVANAVNAVTSATFRAVTKADCTFYAVGSNVVGGIHAVFVAHVVVTTFENRSGQPLDSVPAATGVVCSIKNATETGTEIVEWQAVRPGNSAYDARPQTLPAAGNLEICARAWVIYGDGHRVDYPEDCESS